MGGWGRGERAITCAIETLGGGGGGRKVSESQQCTQGKASESGISKTPTNQGLGRGKENQGFD